MAGMKRTKPPARRVVCDAFTVEVDDTTYRPHAGEYVEFSGMVQLDTMLMAMRLQALGGMNMGDLDREEVADVLSAFDMVCTQLAATIESWSWTDPKGARYPTKPTKDDIRKLTFEELMYLVGAIFGSEAPDGGEDDTKDGDDSSST